MVSGLVVLAIVTVGWRVHSLGQRFSPRMKVQAQEITPAAVASPVEPSQPEVKSKITEWRELFPEHAIKRDPFTTTASSSEK